ncbi:hypothetical protein [Croceimicrobium sp.]|uniref:hypothetical protein n=1 Tax=Croceimicrobium sp. TaxID=2828340 RepID=UPI003BAD8F5A
MIRLLKKLTTAQERYDSAIEQAEAGLKGKIEFDFFIVYQDSDLCWVVVDSENSDNAPLSDCLAIIDEKGKLTLEDYKRKRI